MLTPEQINQLPPELRKLWEIREKSTSGPWQTRFMYRMFKRVRESPGDLFMDSDVEQDWPDAEFCAEAHNLIPELFSYILQVVGEKVKLREELARVYELVNHWSGTAQTAEAEASRLTKLLEEKA